MADEQLTPLQLGQVLNLLSSTVRDLAKSQAALAIRQQETTDAVNHLVEVVEKLASDTRHDRAQLRKLAREVKQALLDNATSQSQEMRAARIDTPIPPLPPRKHGLSRP